MKAGTDSIVKTQKTSPKKRLHAEEVFFERKWKCKMTDKNMHMNMQLGGEMRVLMYVWIQHLIFSNVGREKCFI